MEDSRGPETDREGAGSFEAKSIPGVEQEREAASVSQRSPEAEGRTGDDARARRGPGTPRPRSRRLG